jgi:hypothetical protein
MQMRHLPTPQTPQKVRPNLIQGEAPMNAQDERRVALITDYGIDNAAACVAASHQEYRPTLARCLAMLENESGGRNIFGADPWDPGAYPRGAALPPEWRDSEVTQHRYTIYKERRNAGCQPNGVGPTQITDASLQEAAERAGGCWIPLHNMSVGFGFLHGLIEQLGSVWDGFRAYNGSGPAADAYADRALERAELWEHRLAHRGLS